MLWGNEEMTAAVESGYCPYCSHPPCYVYHGGKCPNVAAQEYYPDGSLKRIEFGESNFRTPGLHAGTITARSDFDEPFVLDGHDITIESRAEIWKQVAKRWRKRALAAEAILQDLYSDFLVAHITDFGNPELAQEMKKALGR